MKKYIDADALLCEIDGLFRDMATALYDSQDDAIEGAEVSIRRIIHNMPYADVKPDTKPDVKSEVEPDVESEMAFFKLLEALSMEFVCDVNTDFRVHDNWCGELAVYKVSNGKEELFDDRGDLFVALRNVAACMFPSAEFRSDDYIYHWDGGMDRIPAVDIEPVRKWITADTPPDNDRPVFIAYRNKNDKSDINIDISRWCEMRSGKMHWFPPFEYFTYNYDVFAWQDLPEPPRMDSSSEEFIEPCKAKGIKRADEETPCTGYGKSEDNDETCEMCKRCVNCDTHSDDIEDGGSE